MKKLLLLFSAAILSTVVNAQWQTNGPSGGQDIISLAISGQNIFAGGYGAGAYLSTNNGGSWAPINTGLPTYATVNALAVSGSKVFAGTYLKGIFMSNNNGTNWSVAGSGIGDETVFSLAANGPNILAGTANGVYLSKDTGNTWMPIDSNLGNSIVGAVAMSEGRLFAGTQFGLYISTDGVSWNTTSRDKNICASLIANGPIIFLGASNGEGAYLSTDTGNTWNEVDASLPVESSVVSFALSGSGIFAATNGGFVNSSPFSGGIFLSTDTGATWAEVKTGTGNTSNVTNALAISASNIFAGTSTNGVYQQAINAVTTGIKEISQTSPLVNFQLYPNPANKNFVVEVTNNVDRLLRVFDITGQLILSRNIENGKTTIDISGLASGIYTVSLKSPDGIATRKLVVGE